MCEQKFEMNNQGFLSDTFNFIIKGRVQSTLSLSGKNDEEMTYNERILYSPRKLNVMELLDQQNIHPNQVDRLLVEKNITKGDEGYALWFKDQTFEMKSNQEQG